MKFFQYIFITSLIIFTTNCSKKEQLKDTATYFGGKIINPKSNMVFFMKNNSEIDTLFLDKNNMFLKKFDNLNEGLYVFKHGPEFQYVYLEPKDSIIIRLNTWDFDESLVFNGKGSNKNEFLLNLFLENEKFDANFYPNYKLPETEFLQKLKDIEAQKEILYKEFKKNQKTFSKGFDAIIQADKILYSNNKKEKYPHYNKSVTHGEHPKLSTSYYNYRTKVDLNNTKLLNFFRYQNYIINYLYNSSYSALKEKPTEGLTLKILQKINQEITLPSFKDELFYRIMIDDFYADNTYTISNEVLDFYYKHVIDDTHKKAIQNLVHDRTTITVGSPLTNFIITNSNGQKHKIKPLIKNKNTVVYFWSPANVSSEALSKRIHYLEKKFSKLHFIGINFDKPTKNPFAKKARLHHQYQLPKDCKAYRFLKSNLPRTILVNRQGKVVNSFTSLDSHTIENQLAKLEKE